jgi:hypothetical protein
MAMEEVKSWQFGSQRKPVTHSMIDLSLGSDKLNAPNQHTPILLPVWEGLEQPR